MESRSFHEISSDFIRFRMISCEVREKREASEPLKARRASMAPRGLLKRS